MACPFLPVPRRHVPFFQACPQKNKKQLANAFARSCARLFDFEDDEWEYKSLESSDANQYFLIKPDGTIHLNVDFQGDEGIRLKSEACDVSIFSPIIPTTHLDADRIPMSITVLSESVDDEILEDFVYFGDDDDRFEEWQPVEGSFLIDDSFYEMDVGLLKGKRKLN